MLIGVPHLAALERVQEKLNLNKIAYHAWHEPDFDYGFTAIATVPISKERKAVLANYRLYSPVVSALKTPARGPVPCSGDAGENPAGGANTEVAQLAEHPG